MPYVQDLRCRACGRDAPVGAVHVCSWCFGPLEVVVDLGALASTTTRSSIAAGPPSIWRYADLLPVLGDGPRVDLGAGWTPLVRAPRLGAALGLRDLWLKNDTLNPTGSFKDRVVSVALTAARQLGFEVVGCASTGNLAHSVSAHAAVAGMEAVVFVPADLEPAKILGSAVYGPSVVAVEGTYDEVNRLCAEVAGDRPWGFVNVNLRPYYAEGSKTIGYEIAEQLGWRVPDQVVAPMASGAMYCKIDKAFGELAALGLVEERACRMFGAQAAGCSPIAAAWKAGDAEVRPVRPSTVARSLAIGDPADGWYALEVARRTGGALDDVSDEEVVDAMLLLARTEGILGETAAGVTVGVLRKLASAGALDPDATTVAVISGHGLKTLDAVAGRVGPAATIRPRLDDLDAAFATAGAAP